jgi:nucleotide-binding universal stress UspA family protein
MYGNVLVPLDGSTFSERALSYAVPIARQTGGVLHLILVHEPIARYAVEIAPNRLIDRWEAQQRDREVRYVERRAATLADKGIDALNMHRLDWTGGLTTLVHRFGVLAFAWDAQLPRVLAELVDMGIDAVYSDHVDRMVDAVTAAVTGGGRPKTT